MLRDTANIRSADLLTLQEMEQSAFTFHLSGSHYFGCARSDSDLDWMAEYSGALVQWLKDQGFKVMGGEQYGDGHGNTHAVYEKGKIQVSLPYHLKAKLFARNTLAEHFADEHRKAGKSLRSEVWSALIEAYQRVEEEFSPILSF